jgi:hypothetical protein
MKKLLVVLLLLYPLSASAQTYQWTDERGTVNFTEDLGKVPKKYRKKVKVLGLDESGVPQVIESTEPGKGRTKELGTPKDNKALYGGKDEAAWRNEFATAKRELKVTEQELADLRGRMGDTSKMSRSEYLALQNTINHNEFRVQELRKRLDLLREKADKAGVPADLR